MTDIQKRIAQLEEEKVTLKGKTQIALEDNYKQRTELEKHFKELNEQAQVMQSDALLQEAGINRAIEELKRLEG